MATVRPPAVAGKFYPADRQELRKSIISYLNGATDHHITPKAMIAPHAGYVYSGPIAATAYAQLKNQHGTIKRVLLLGPAHYLRVRGLAASSAERFATPLGEVRVDRDAVEELLHMPQVAVVDEAHAPEHCLEVQLPFLQMLLDDFSIVPLLVGQASTDEVSEVIEKFWSVEENLIVVSSDLSHFQPYRQAVAIDAATSRAIENLQSAQVGPQEACGHRSIESLLAVARHHGARADVLDVRNSGDTAGTHDRVVGYGAYAFE